jgi:outer membrane protein
MFNRFALISAVAVIASISATPAYAQDKGDSYLKIAAARTKLVDKGQVYTNNVLDPAAAYKTRNTFHGVLTGGYYVIDNVSLDASISTPATTNNIPAGSLAGTPNLGDDEFILATFGASVHPIRGPISPYVGGGLAVQITTQERDGLAVGLNIPNAHGPYVNAGIDFALNSRAGFFFDVRKAWYHTSASGKLPLDATYTVFADVKAKAVLDPLTVQIGAIARFGKGADTDTAIAPDTTKWTVRGGISSLTLSDRVALKVGGATYPGAALSTIEHQTVSVQIGRFLTKHVAVNATLGLPPTIDIYGGGSIGALPKLGKITYGPTAFTLQYHPTREGRIRPYVGAGVSYMISFATKDGAFQNLKVGDDLAPAFEAGTDIMVSNNMGLFLDVKKAFLRPSTSGTFQGAAVEGKTALDPWVFSSGVAVHF